MDTSFGTQSTLRKKYEQIFLNAYKNLNARQKEAVDAIEGPVLVNAGPGTGKTQILATRIGKILFDQDVKAHNILCLTYTEAATVSMRNRLVKIIGPTAHQIHIHTFHGFCNQVIQENLEFFGGYKKLEPISDLEEVDIYEALIDALDDNNPLKRFKADRYYESGRMKNLFSLMKKENYTPKTLNKHIDEYLEKIKNVDADEEVLYKKYKYQRKYKEFKAGDLKPKEWKLLTDKMDLLRYAVAEYDNFIKLMDAAERYDYGDMILWVIRAFEKNSDLLSKYQERYLYTLVDEYQDTNGAQNDILNHLISYWDNPNVFVVGDDDQAIYKFQGANLGNIMAFQKKYDPKTIILEENYRSNQDILDFSKKLIDLNAERMVKELTHLSKDLVASGKYKDHHLKPKIFAFDKTSLEIAYLASEIEKIHLDPKQDASDVAILYRKHKQVDELVTVLEKRNVPINVKKRINILELPIIKNLIHVLSYLNEEYNKYGLGEGRLFEILHYNYFKIDSIDIGKIAMFCQYKRSDEKKEDADILPDRSKWRNTISSESELEKLNLRSTEAVLKTGQLLDKWIAQIPEVTIQTLFENIINDGGILNYIMTQSNKAWLLQVVNTFFNFIKKESEKNPGITLDDLLIMFSKMKDNKISLPVNKTISSENGVNFVTAHSAKGAEFKKVFIIGTIKNIWDKNYNRNQQYSYPDTINADSDISIEDERRLFYVAMTRAKTDLIITYSEANEEGKELGQSQFIDEIKATSDVETEKQFVDEETSAQFYFNLLKRADKTIPLIEKDLIDAWLEGYSMSVTHLNKYLRCPITFYFESILKVPHARNAYAGFGNAMHNALHHFFLYINKSGELVEEKLLYYFEESMKKYRSNFTNKEFDSFMTHGKRTLTALYQHKQNAWSQPQEFAVEETLKNAHHKGIPIKGVIDKVEIFKDRVHVVDYKTGNYSNPKTRIKLKGPSEKDENGGDYWRQVVFYKILLDSDKKHNWLMRTGEIDFIEPDKKSGKFSSTTYEVTPEDISIVGTQITESYEKIKNYEFDKTCEDDECMWCNFIKDNYTLNGALKNSEFEYE